MFNFYLSIQTQKEVFLLQGYIKLFLTLEETHELVWKWKRRRIKCMFLMVSLYYEI